MKSKLHLVILFSLVFFNVLNAQKSGKITITGTVVDLNNKPIENAMITIDGQKTTALTDTAGNYSVKVKATATKLGVLTLGNGYFEEEIGNRNKIDISFSTVTKVSPYSIRNDDSDSEEAALQGRSSEGEVPVNIGYAIVKRKYLTGDIQLIDPRDKKIRNYTSVQEMVLGEVSGVAKFGERIVFLSSKNFGGFVDPLIIIDGVYSQPGDLSIIRPNTLESVAVLKGAAAAIYGSRGYGGAILVTTKMSN
jgi:TonB-dependent SusC/RagA subfamily outer membrane receptor